jgi:hypothetical protein
MVKLSNTDCIHTLHHISSLGSVAHRGGSCAYTNRVRTFLLGLLVDVHSGLDLPWGYDKILPFGTVAGSCAHAIHHRTGEDAFQPFFCWWDAGLEWIEPKSGAKSKNESI